MTVASPLDPWAYVRAQFAEPEEDTAATTPGPATSYKDRPADFARHMIRWPPGARLEDYQAEALNTLARDRRLVVRGPHGLGKTTVEALAILWFAITREAAGVDWKCPTTAGVGRQLSEYLWPEVHKWANRVRWEMLGIAPWREGRELLDTAIKLRHGHAFAATVNNAAAIEGAHARSLLFVFTEAKLIDAGVFEAAEGAFSGAGGDTADEAFALVQSTPGAPEGRFYDLCRRKAGTEDWTFQRVTKDQVIAAGRMSREWAEARLKDWGARSAVYLNRVEGEFAGSAADGVIPLSWVEAANDRWAEAVGRSFVPEYLGVDVGISADQTVITPMAGDLVAMPVRPDLGGSDRPLTQVAGHVGRMMSWHPSGPAAVIDTDGIGAGVYEQVAALEFLSKSPHQRVFAFHAGAGTKWRDRSGQLEFDNTRAAAWWNLRDELDPDNGATLALPPDDLLTGDLTAPRWRYGRGGRIVIESKDDLRKRIGRSTDTGDSVVMGRWGRLMSTTSVLVRAADHAGGPRERSLLDDRAVGF